jgi:hypothetical protein
MGGLTSNCFVEVTLLETRPNIFIHSRQYVNVENCVSNVVFYICMLEVRYLLRYFHHF